MLVGTQVQYVVNAPVTIDGGDGFDKTVALATEFADHLVVDATGVYGAGPDGGVQRRSRSLEVDVMEGDDTVDVALDRRPASATRVIGNLGSDVVNVAGDVAPDVVLATAGTITSRRRRTCSPRSPGRSR